MSADTTTVRVWRLYVGRTTAGGYGFSQNAAEKAILAILQREGIPGATIYNALGVWEGEREGSTVVEWWTESQGRTVGGARCAARHVARAIARALNQTAVAVVESSATVSYVGS